MDAYALMRGEVIVVVLYDHVLELRHYAVRHRSVLRVHIHTDHYGGGEVLAHHVHRKVVVYAAVVKLHSVYLYRCENGWEGHGRADGIAQHTAAAHHLVLVCYIRCHAAERHKQIVEIAAALGCIGCEEVHECEIHRERRNKARWHEPLRGRCRGVAPAEVHIQVGECRGARLLQEIVGEVRVNLSG